MMRRVVAVTSGYLKYAFACTLAATVISILARLAVNQPRAFLVVAVVAVIGFCVVRSEVKVRRHSRALSHRTK